MDWNLGHYLMSRMVRLAEVLPVRQGITGTRRKRAPVAPTDRYGCCPVCREFVRVRQAVLAGYTPCPSCGRMIRSLRALGDDGPDPLAE